MKVGSQPGLKVSTWVNPSRSYRPRRFGWQSSRSLAHPCVRAAWRQASISAELTPRPACVRRTASLCRYAASPLRASGQNSGSSADKVQQPTMPSLQLATRSSDLRTKVSANVRSIRATSQAGVPLADIHAAASCISRTTSSISPEQATRTFGGSSLSIRSPWRGMNRRLIVQFDPDEPSMSAPTFAEPDQGPLAGGRKVNARHDLTLGLWRRDCEISRGFPRR
ncbi:hypothetical protein NH10_003519 [Acinetobacter baumannii]|nr:hypothetical protein NH10_003519 [Acinetobacter baumannii]